MQKQFLEAGRIVGTHGIAGEMRLECWCNTPAFLSKFKRLYTDSGSKELSVSCRPHKNIVLVRVKGVSSIEEADAYRGKILCINRDDAHLSKGEHFVQDIIGLTVTDADTGEIYGTVTDVLKTGSNDVYEMKKKDGKPVYIPVIPDVIKRLDFEEERVYIRPMKGLFDDED